MWSDLMWFHDLGNGCETLWIAIQKGCQLAVCPAVGWSLRRRWLDSPVIKSFSFAADHPSLPRGMKGQMQYDVIYIFIYLYCYIMLYRFYEWESATWVLHGLVVDSKRICMLALPSYCLKYHIARGRGRHWYLNSQWSRFTKYIVTRPIAKHHQCNIEPEQYKSIVRKLLFNYVI